MVEQATKLSYPTPNNRSLASLFLCLTSSLYLAVAVALALNLPPASTKVPRCEAPVTTLSPQGCQQQYALCTHRTPMLSCSHLLLIPPTLPLPPGPHPIRPQTLGLGSASPSAWGSSRTPSPLSGTLRVRARVTGIARVRVMTPSATSGRICSIEP